MIQLVKHFGVSFGPETSEVKFFSENVYIERFSKKKHKKKHNQIKPSKKTNKPLHAGNNEYKKKYSRKA